MINYEELEIMVCGVVDIDIDILKKNTNEGGVS